jgi:LPXTG-motif cell wall-anchored protein
MAKNQMSLIVGIVLLAAGIAAAVYGIYIYNNLQASVMNQLEKAFVGSTEGETQAFIFIGAGAVSAVVGLVLLLSKKKRRRRR